MCILNTNSFKTRIIIKLVLNQTYQKLDIVVYSNKKTCLLNDRRIKYITTDIIEKGNIHKSFVKESIGEYMYFVDCDKSYRNDFFCKI